MATYRVWERMALGFARQSDQVTINDTDGDFTYFWGQVSSPPDHMRKLMDFAPAISQVGGNAPRLPGSKVGNTFTTRFPWRAAAGTYDNGAGGGGSDVFGTTDGIISPEHLLLGNALGSAGSGSVAAASDFTKGKHLSNSAGIANDVGVGSDATKIAVPDASLYKSGQLVVAMTGTSDANPAVGWITDPDTAAGPPEELLLAENIETAAIPVNTDETFDTSVAYLSAAARVPLTFRLMGENAGFKGAYVGCMATALRVDLTPGDIWWIEIDWRTIDRKDFSSGGSLEQPVDFNHVPALLSEVGGRFVYGAQGSAAQVAGWRDMQLEVTWELSDISDINQDEGVAEQIPLKATTRFRAKVPVEAGDTISAAGEDPFETLLTDQTRKAIQITAGVDPGQIGSLYMPALQMAEVPKREVVDGLEYYALEWEPGQFSGDDGETAPADTLVRFGIA